MMLSPTLKNGLIYFNDSSRKYNSQMREYQNSNPNASPNPKLLGGISVTDIEAV